MHRPLKLSFWNFVNSTFVDMSLVQGFRVVFRVLGAL